MNTRRRGGVVAAAAIVCIGLYGSTGVAAAAVGAVPTVSAVSLDIREGNGPQALHLKLDVPAAVPTSFRYELGRGTAQPGSDFLAGGGTATFAAGAVDGWTEAITPIDDRVPEGSEWIRMRTSSASLVVPKVMRVRIIDDDWFGSPSVSPSTDLIDGQLVRIQASGLSPGLKVWPHQCERSCVIGFPAVVVDQHGRLDTTVKVRRIFDDYGGAPYDCLFASGCFIKLHIESGEDGLTIGNRTPITFRRVIPEPAISVDNVSVIEGSRSDVGWTSASLTVRLDHPTDGPVAFNLTSIPVTAGADDYSLTLGYGTIPAGATSLTVPFAIAIKADMLPEADEVFAAVFGYVAGAHVAPSGGAYVTIIDDD